MYKLRKLSNFVKNYHFNDALIHNNIMKKVYVKIDANIYIYIYIYLYYIFLLMALIQGIKGLDKLYLKSLHLYLIKL
jgi:hypothetical protein